MKCLEYAALPLQTLLSITRNASITKMEILMPRGFMVFSFCMKVCAHSHLIVYWDHFLFLFLYCLKTQNLIHYCIVSILCIVTPLISKGWCVGFGKSESAPCTWSGHYFALQCQNCSELRLYFRSPWWMNTKRHSATRKKWNQQGKEAATVCFPPYHPLKKKCRCWAPLCQRAGAEGCAEPGRLLLTPERSSSGRRFLPVTPCGHFILWRGSGCLLLLLLRVWGAPSASARQSGVTEGQAAALVHWLCVIKEQFSHKWGRRTV